MPVLAAAPLIECRGRPTTPEEVEIHTFRLVLRERANRVQTPDRAAGVRRIVEHVRLRAHISCCEAVSAPAAPLHHDSPAIKGLPDVRSDANRDQPLSPKREFLPAHSQGHETEREIDECLVQIEGILIR